uniref:ApeA N-terminal domain 1-containing protein n=1 Tax=Vibrio jasicida TaxID=766224 RepID=UPI00403847AA
MFDDKKNLNLDKTYSYTVYVKDKDQNFAGKLTLSPDKCTLKVMGERSPSCDFYQSSQIECSSFDKSFMLFELSNVSGSFQNLQYATGKQIGFFEYEFEVGFVICSEGNLRSYDDTISFCIKSEMIYKWVGYTNLQQELIEKYQARTLNPLSDSLEFEQILEGYGKLRLFYHYQTHNNVLEFRTGLNFPPKLSVHFSSPIRMNNLHFEYKKFYHLMTLFIGSDFKVNEVTITTNRQISTFNTSIYFPKPHQNHERDYPVFPLSLNLRFYGENDVNLPLESFNNYYNLKEED